MRTANGNPISARAAVKKPSMSTSSTTFDPTEENSRGETTQLMDDLKERLQRAEIAAEEFKRHNEALQSRLDDVVKEQSKQEEKMHEDEEHIEELENEKRELLKQKRELETIYEAERAAVMKDSEATHAREEDLQSIIQRLKDSLSQKDSLRTPNNEDVAISRNGKFCVKQEIHWWRSVTDQNKQPVFHHRHHSMRISLRLPLCSAVIRRGITPNCYFRRIK